MPASPRTNSWRALHSTRRVPAGKHSPSDNAARCWAPIPRCSLSGRTHEVLTAVALVANSEAVRISTSSVTFRTLSEAECAAYWETGEPADKAGAYAVQGLAAMFISRLDGSYSGVMGLPLYETAQLLKEFGIEVL
jgi:predicted house-cleaning NTP pyrophosphatase (Maf/HAM1 superfamily)